MTKKKLPAGEDWTASVYWKQPVFDPAEIGDPNDAGIFMAVGAALSRWEQMEDTLADMFNMFGTDKKQSITNHSHQMGRHMFGMIESSSTRLKLLEVAASLYFARWWGHKAVRDPYVKLLEVSRTHLIGATKLRMAEGYEFRCIEMEDRPKIVVRF